MGSKPSSRIRAIAIESVGVGVAAALTLSGCAAGVTAPHPDQQAAALCHTLIKNLPTTVDGQRQRSVKPDSGLTAAWGHPAITLACGVTKPAGMNAASRCWEVNKVGWYEQVRDSDIRFTTLGRKTLVQVTVPNKYAPQADALTDVAHAISAHIPVVQKCV